MLHLLVCCPGLSYVACHSKAGLQVFAVKACVNRARYASTHVHPRLSPDYRIE